MVSGRLPRCGNERGKQTQWVRFTRTAEVDGRSGEFASRRESRPSFARHGRAKVPPQTGSSPHNQLHKLLHFLLQDDG
jgi:hypothetical protein